MPPMPPTECGASSRAQSGPPVPRKSVQLFYRPHPRLGGSGPSAGTASWGQLLGVDCYLERLKEWVEKQAMGMLAVVPSLCTPALQKQSDPMLNIERKPKLT